MTALRAQRAHRADPRIQVRVLQRTLYRAAKANPRRRFGVLYDKVCRRDVLEEAARRVLANIYLNHLDRLWDKGGYARRTDSWQGVLVRYADDLVILTRTEAAARRYFAWLEKLFERMELTINREKTRIARIADGFDFLGLTFKEARGRGTGRRFVLSYPRRKAMQAIRRKVKETVRQHPPSTPIRKVVNGLNSVLRGWGTYFRDSNASRHFRLIDRHASEQVRLFLRRKHRRMDRRGYRDWPDPFLYRDLGLYRLSGRLAMRRSAECRTG